MTRLFYTVVMLVVVTQGLIANDAYLGSRGGSVFPIYRNSSIRMMKEEINIKLGRDSGIVFCRFWFKNLKASTEGVLMGFPDYFENLSQGSMALRNFDCKVRGKITETDKRIQIEKYNDDTTIVSYDRWYCWYVYFEPGETVMVENCYSGDWGGRIDFTATFDYLIGTAQTWCGTIGSGKVVFDYSKLASSLFLDTADYAGDPLPQGMHRKIYADSVVFSYNDYLPEWNESLSVRFIRFWNSPMLDPNRLPEENPFLMRFESDAILPKERLRLMRNEIYARHGYVFSDPGLKAYFAAQPWYTPDEHFTTQRLDMTESLFVSYLKILENK